MKNWLKRQRIEWEDWARYSPWTRNLMSRVALFRAKRMPEEDDAQIVRKIAKFSAAARWTFRDNLQDSALAEFHRLAKKLRVDNVDWSQFVLDVDVDRMDKATLLKPWVSEREKGVLYISFEYEWTKLMQRGIAEDVAQKYDVVIAPSASPHNLPNYLFPLAFPGTIFTQISNQRDTVVLPKISSRFVVVPIYASSWVMPEAFVPLPRSERDIDLIMVANFAKVKRHSALFAAIRNMPAHYRILLVGQAGDGETAETLMHRARVYGVEDRFTLKVNATHDEVASAFARSRASVILSRQEGSCVVVTESMFADTPAALLEGAVIGSTAFINEHTGRLLPGRRLGDELTQFIEESDRYRPRAWAEENISCHVNSRRLNDLVKQHSLERGEAWTVDLAPLQWCPDPELIHADDRQRMSEATKDFFAQYGLHLGRPRDDDPETHPVQEVSGSAAS